MGYNILLSDNQKPIIYVHFFYEFNLPNFVDINDKYTDTNFLAMETCKIFRTLCKKKYLYQTVIYANCKFSSVMISKFEYVKVFPSIQTVKEIKEKMLNISDKYYLKNKIQTILK